MKRIGMSWMVAFCMAAGLAGAAWAAGIEHFSPLGEQVEVSQAQARFSAPMAPLGQSDAPAPFNVECAVAGHGYWADERTWVQDLNTTPMAGETCRFRPRPGLTTLTGDAVVAEAEYRFTMAGPRLVWHLPHADATIDEDQVFVVVANGAATAESIQKHARCEVQGIHEAIPARRVTGSRRTQILTQLKDHLRGSGIEDATDTSSPRVAGLELLQCARPLPANAKMAVVWGAGIATASGQANPSDQHARFTVRDHFSARLRCDRENAKAGCLPMTPARLEFTAPVARAYLDRIALKDDKGKVYPSQRVEQPAPYDNEVVFPGPFPEKAKLTLTLPDRLVDDKGRALVNAARFPLAIRIGEYPPMIKFAGDFGIVERVGGALLPVTLRNLEGDGGRGTAARVRWVRTTDDIGMLDWQARLRKFEFPEVDPETKRMPDQRRARFLAAGTDGLVERALPKAHGAQTFEVVGVPLDKPGFYVVEAESRRLGKSLLGEDRPMYVRTTALVTNLAVHFKWGEAGSLAWVTRLDLGRPVAGARVSVRDCRGKAYAEAVTDRQGMARLPSGVPDPRSVDSYGCPLLVSARAGDDYSFARSDWDEGIESWRFGLPWEWRSEKRLAHTVLDRVLFRPGDSVHMKHVLRDKLATGLGYPARPPRTLLIEHEASNQRWFQPLVWKNGAAESVWRVPDGAKRGDYRLRLVDKDIRPDTDPAQLHYLEGIDSGAFSVGDFRVPLMKADIDPTKPRWIGTDSAEFDLAVRYLNGGGARGLPVRLRAQLEPRHHVDFKAHEGYRFALRADGENGSEESENLALNAEPLTLDAGGAARARVTAIPALRMPHDLRVEMEYADPNGEIQTVSRVTPWWPADVVLGIRNDNWTRAGQRHTLEFLAVDPDGSPVAGVPVEANLSLRQNLSHRVRLAGGFYAWRQEIREQPLATGCTGKTDAKGRFSCAVETDAGGEVIVSARALDARGRVARTTQSFWVAGRDEWVFNQDNHDRIDLIPEKKRYEPGETARFQVRMPYRKATALVTVEREGVLDARVVTLSGTAPVIDVPIKAGWAPNVYVSALAVRGRNDAVRPTALVDLGRPAFKLGIAGIEVGRRAHELAVEIKTDRSRYQIRETAKARIKVRTPDGAPPPAGTEVIVAAVDEGLLELAPNASWNLIDAMTGKRGYTMRTFTAQMQVTGKRHFGRKALPAGGGGGKLPTRELFDTLLLWRGTVSLDAKGEASVDIPLNDSLTAFRVVAVASSESRFGTGATSIHTSQDLQLISGLSPVAREGDQARAYFTVRNGSDRAMKLEVTASVAGLDALPARKLDLGAGESREIAWPVTVPAGRELDWTLTARELGGKARDALKVRQEIRDAVPVRVQSAALHRLETLLDLPIAAPTGGLPGKSEARATLAASLADGQTMLRDYMRRYPYTCLEQQVSRAVSTRDADSWRELTGRLPTYLAENGLLNFFPGTGQGDVALTAYLLALADEAGWALPVDARARMEQALADFVAGKLDSPRARGLGVDADIVRRLAALEALARHGKASPALIATIRPEPGLWPSSAVIDWIGVLKRVGGLAERDQWLKAALATLEARFTDTGRRLNFQNENRDSLWWMMTSADTNAVRALLALIDEPGWKDRLPRLATSVLGRQERGRWDTTTANAWGSLALERYKQRFEAVKPTGKSYAVLGQEGRVIDWRNLPKGATAFLPLTGETGLLRLRHDGQGNPYAIVTTLAAVPITAPVARGYAVSREIRAVERKTPGKWSRGDILRVRLTIDARDDMGWVVVEDPIPAGASILGGAGQRASRLLTQGETDDGAWPAWRESLFDGFRAYYDYLPRGRHSLEYTVRLNADGRFQLPPTRVEAMYAPEMHGESPNGLFEVAP